MSNVANFLSSSRATTVFRPRQQVEAAAVDLRAVDGQVDLRRKGRQYVHRHHRIRLLEARDPAAPEENRHTADITPHRPDRRDIADARFGTRADPRPERDEEFTGTPRTDGTSE